MAAPEVQLPPQRVEQSRAQYPDEEGYVERDGVRIFYELYGAGERTVLFLPTGSIIHSRHWKAQIPYFARLSQGAHLRRARQRRSDLPRGADAYVAREFANDTLAVMDATGTKLGIRRTLLLAVDYLRRR